MLDSAAHFNAKDDFIVIEKILQNFNFLNKMEIK